MRRQILSRWDGSVLWEGEAATVKDAIHAAFAAKANLRGADLGGANLGGAKDLRLPTGELFDDYLTSTLPALLTASGKSLGSFKEHWDCHDWTNCPMAHAFGAKGVEDVPILLRPRADQFIQLFDAKQLPWAVVQATIDKQAHG